jgi:hypothetical protein
MSYIDPNELLRCLVSEVRSGADFSTSPLIARILEAMATAGLVGIPHAVLVRMQLGFEFLEEEAEILVTCSLPQVFENLRAAYNDERLRLEVRTQTESAPSCMGDDVNLRGDEELEIYGVVERYCVFCIRRHARLNCLAFQFC